MRFLIIGTALVVALGIVIGLWAGANLPSTRVNAFFTGTQSGK